MRLAPLASGRPSRLSSFFGQPRPLAVLVPRAACLTAPLVGAVSPRRRRVFEVTASAPLRP